MIRFKILTASLVFLLPALSMAQEVCRKDIRTHCQTVPAGDKEAVAKCLRIHGKKVSKSCRNYLAAQKKSAKAKRVKERDHVAECRVEQKRYCSGVKPGNGRIKACLRLHKQKLSDRCREALKKKSLFY